MRIWTRVASGLLCGAAAVSAVAQVSPVPVAKQTVRTKDDLPRHTYAVPGTAVALLNADDATFNAWAKRVDDDIVATLAAYDIQDHATLRGLLDIHAAYQILTHQDQAALVTTQQIRALQDKPDAKLVSGLRREAIVRARMETGQASGAAFEQAFARLYAPAVAALPWPVAGTRLKEIKSQDQIQSSSIVEGFIRQTVEPVVASDHRVSDGPAGDLIWARSYRVIEAPVQHLALAAVARVVAANNVVKPDIWASREVTLTAADHPTPVVAAVWDSGIDLSLFPGRVYTDPRPVSTPPYHPHGLSFDVQSNPTTGWLYPLTPAQQREYRAMINDFQGFSDLEQSIDSPAADALRAKMAAMPSEQVPDYLERLSLYGGYLHGTHVAGIMARGNPAIRLVAARLTFDYHNVRPVPNEAWSRRTAASYQTYVDWFRTHGVRVVNMSWSGTPAQVEQDLEKNGAGGSPSERRALARRLFAIERDGLLAALRSAPDILFVCAAGNSEGDNGFEEAMPSGFTLPNLLTVSAVDRGGDEASFTSYGANVVVSANGYQVDSSIPGGGHLLDSGTSMASPNVANLAAKLIALDPTLTPARTIKLIRDAATPSADGRRRNINPRASVALLRSDSG